MGSGSLSPVPAKSPLATLVSGPTRVGVTTSSSPTPSSSELAATGDDMIPNSRTGHHHHHHHHHHCHHRHHRSERDDRSRSPSHHRSSRPYDERYERRDDNDQRSANSNIIGGDSYRPTSLPPSSEPTEASSRHHGDSYRPAILPPSEATVSTSRHHDSSYNSTPLPPPETTTTAAAAAETPTSSSSSSSRYQDRYQPRYEDSRYDTMGHRDNYPSDYNRHQSPYYSSQQHQRNYYRHDRPSYSHRDYRSRHHQSTRYHEPYEDRRYPRYEPRPRSPRRVVDRGTEEERQKSTIIFTGNLPYDYCERDVAVMFERYGKLVKITIPIDNLTTRNKGFAFVEFEHRHEAQEAFDNFQGFSVGGRRLKLDWDIGLNKKDNRRTPRSEDYRHTNNHAIRSSSSSSPPPRIGRETDTYIPSRGQVQAAEKM
ncbi:unnamed protein product [Absidia cylindrospora]